MKKGFMYQCYDCGRDIENTTGEHYEIHFVKGMKQKHHSMKEITVCKKCFMKRMMKTRANEFIEEIKWWFDF